MALGDTGGQVEEQRIIVGFHPGEKLVGLGHPELCQYRSGDER